MGCDAFYDHGDDMLKLDSKVLPPLFHILMLFFTNIAIFDAFVPILVFFKAFVPVLDHILMLFQAEICLCGRDRCNNDDPIPEVEKQANPPPTYI